MNCIFQDISCHVIPANILIIQKVEKGRGTSLRKDSFYFSFHEKRGKLGTFFLQMDASEAEI